MRTALLQFIDAAIEKIRNLFKSIFDRKDNALEYDFNNDYLDEEIEQRDRRIKLFNKEVGSNPLDHIDWIIENGLVKYNKKYQYFVSGEHERDEQEKRMETSMAEWSKSTEVQVYQSLSECDDYSDRTMDITEIRGGIGNKVLYTFEDYYSEKNKIYQEIFDGIDREINKI